MAIDTAEKRRAAGAVGQVWMAPGVTPNILKDEEWRQQVAWSYSGVSVAATSTAVVLADENPFVYRHRMQRVRTRS